MGNFLSKPDPGKRAGVLLEALFLAVFLAASASPASANVGEAFGFGARSSALAGAVVADDSQGYTAYSNPAGLAHSRKESFAFSYGLVLMEPSFLPINNVIVENNAVSDTSRNDNVDVDYRSTFGQAIGFSYRLFPEAWRTSIGITSFLPVQQVAYVDSGETYAPEYPLYRDRTQRSQIEIGMGAAPSDSFRFGAGVHVGYALTSQTSIFVTPDASKASSMRFSAAMKLKAAPYFGLQFFPAENLSIGFVARAPMNSQSTIQVRSAAEIIGSFDLSFLARSALVYDPTSFELGMSFAHSPAARLFAQLDAQLWSHYKTPAFQIESPSVANCSPSCGVSFQGSQIPPVVLRDILVPRIGEEIDLGGVTLRVGYGYRPSIFKSAPTGQGNLLDPAKHMMNLGLGRAFPTLFGLPRPWQLDFDFSYHLLVRQEITKDPGTIGAPGYEAGGKILGGGLSLSVAL